MKDGLKCFLHIRRGSWFQFMSLDFGGNKRWNESSFVLVDGDFAPFQPRLSFGSLPRINFGWLSKWLMKQNITLNLGGRTTSTGIFVFAADSEVQLYYHNAVMTGLDQFFFNIFFTSSNIRRYYFDKFSRRLRLYHISYINFYQYKF